MKRSHQPEMVNKISAPPVIEGMIKTTTWNTYGAWSLFTNPTKVVSSFTTV